MAASIVLTLAILAILVGLASPAALWEQLSGIHWGWLLAASASYVVILAIDSLRLLYLLHPDRHAHNHRTWASALVAPAANMLLPARAGDIGVLTGTRSSPLPLAQRARRLALLRLIDLAVLLALALVMLGASLERWPIAAAALAAVVGIAAAIWFRGDVLVEALASRLGLPTGGLRHEAEPGRARSLAIMTGVSLLYWLVQPAYTCLLVIALGLDVPFTILVGALSVANLAKVLPITPGGTAIYSTALSLTLLSVTMLTQDAAIALALLDEGTRLVLTAALPLLLAAILLAREEVGVWAFLRQGDIRQHVDASAEEA